MISLLISILSLFAIFLVYKLYIKPKRQIDRYTKIFENLGFKVKAYPYTFFSVAKIAQEKKDIAEYHDSMHTWKFEHRKYDVVIFNILNNVVLEFANVDLLKEILAPDKVDIYHKTRWTFPGTALVLGEGLLLSEGNAWRRKRKILSSMFTYDMLLANIPTITAIVDRSLD